MGRRRRVAMVAAGALAVGGSLLVAPAEASVVTRASCKDGGGDTWQTQVYWADRASGGLRSITAAGFKTTGPTADTVDYKIRVYNAAGSLVSYQYADDMSYEVGSWFNRNPNPEPQSSPGKVKVTISVGDGNDGKANCITTFLEPANVPAPPPPSTPPPSPPPPSATPTPTPPVTPTPTPEPSTPAPSTPAPSEPPVTPTPTSTPTVDPEPEPLPASARATRETVPYADTDGYTADGDVADDSVVYTNGDDSVVIGASKATNGKGGIAVFDMDGNRLQFLQGQQIGNVDLRVTPERVIVGANRRDNNTAVYWTLNPTTKTLTPYGSHSTGTNYGFCMYRAANGDVYSFTTGEDGWVRQYKLTLGSSVSGSLVRSFDGGGITEGCAADDENAALYIAEEDNKFERYGANPTDGGASDKVDVDREDGPNLAADIEGVEIVKGDEPGQGAIIVSSQGDDRFAVYERGFTKGTGHAGTGEANDHIRNFNVIGSSDGTVDAVTDTDGLSVSRGPNGPNFPNGVLVVHDNNNTGARSGSSNLKYVPLDQVYRDSEVVPEPTDPPTAPPATDSAAVKLGWGDPISGDEFNYTGPADPDLWSVYNGPGHSDNGTRNPANVTVNGSALEMVGKTDGSTGGMSSRFDRANSSKVVVGATESGRWETRMRVAGSTNGVFDPTKYRAPDWHPVLILWPDNPEGRFSGNQCQEMDYSESTTDPTVVKTYNHYACPNVQEISAGKPLAAGQWYNFAVEWQSDKGGTRPGYFRTYVDGVLMYETTTASKVHDHPLHSTIQLDNFREGGGGDAESRMQVDWTRYYQPS